ncbi:hypothetical protein Droror1_Dr00023629 [Drosera rotundifolia]
MAMARKKGEKTERAAAMWWENGAKGSRNRIGKTLPGRQRDQGTGQVRLCREGKWSSLSGRQREQLTGQVRLCRAGEALSGRQREQLTGQVRLCRIAEALPGR